MCVVLSGPPKLPTETHIVMATGGTRKNEGQTNCKRSNHNNNDMMKYTPCHTVLTCPATLSLLLLLLLLPCNIPLCQGQSEADDASSSSSTERSRPVVVNLPGLGKVQGRRDGPIDFFGGLPFAAPPVGNLRWAPPEVCGRFCRWRVVDSEWP